MTRPGDRTRARAPDRSASAPAGGARTVASPQRSATGDARSQALDAAQDLLRTRGYNGFSYKDVASALGVSTTAIHYHFPAKEDLATAFVARYRERFRDELARLEQVCPESMTRLRRFVTLFGDALAADLAFCPCGMLAAERDTLPERVAAEAAGFFADGSVWLARVLDDGRRDGGLRFAGGAEARADLLLAAVEGALVLARASGEPGRFGRVMARLLDDLDPEAPGRAVSGDREGTAGRGA